MKVHKAVSRLLNRFIVLIPITYLFAYKIGRLINFINFSSYRVLYGFNLLVYLSKQNYITQPIYIASLFVLQVTIAHV